MASAVTLPLAPVTASRLTQLTHLRVSSILKGHRTIFWTQKVFYEWVYLRLQCKHAKVASPCTRGTSKVPET